MAPLSSADKKLLKEITSAPWPANLPPPLSEPVENLDDEHLSDLTGFSYAPWKFSCGRRPNSTGSQDTRHHQPSGSAEHLLLLRDAHW